jgi:uncharacterized repeat protein (TIGR01451 family)
VPPPSSGTDTDTDDDGDSDEPSPGITLFDPAISKIGVLGPGQLGLVGEQLEWVITVSNPSSVVGTNIVITDTLRPELQIDGVSNNVSSTISGQTVTVTIPTLNPGQSVTFSIFTTVLQSSISVDNTVCLTATNSRSNPCCTTSPPVGLLSVTTLPNTGETPLWARELQALLSMIGLD